MTEPFIDAPDELAGAPRSPSDRVPERQPGSIRRTTSMDIVWTAESVSGVQFRGMGRDIITQADGTALTRGQIVVTATTDDNHHLVSMEAPGVSADVRELLGSDIRRGFRSAVTERLRSRGTSSLLCLLLDDLPVVNVIANYARLAARQPYVGSPATTKADICAGYRSDGTQLTMVRELGRRPRHVGPPAPNLATPDDPDAWHNTPELQPHDMRRLRRMDLHRDDGVLHVDAFFRDTHREPNGGEAIVHEYALLARVDARSGIVQMARARPNVLPYPECPIAAGSVLALHGQATQTLRQFVRTGLRGPSTCTHLTDLVAMLADVPHLAAALP